MNKRKKITFDHAWEIAKWLEENPMKKLYFYGESSCGLIYSNGFHHVSDSGDLSSFSELWRERTFYIDKSWEECLSKDNPILCMAWDSPEDTKELQIIDEYRHEIDEYKYVDITASGWIFAQPVTLEEAKKYIWECQS